MAAYYNARHVPKQFKIGDLVKLSTKNLKLKYWKLSSCWIDLFRVLEQIGGQVYRLALSTKYDWLHPVFPVQLLEDYHQCHDDTELMIMSDLEDFQNEWDMKKVRNKQQIQSTIHYLIKWAGWSSEYNFYKSVSHLTNILKVIVNYEWKLKYKHKKTSQINIDEISDSEDISHKQMHQDKIMWFFSQ